MSDDPFVFASVTGPYRRPYSGLFGTDSEALDILLSVHAALMPTILDCTYNSGKMWHGVSYPHHRKTLDIDPQFSTDYVGDFRNLEAIVGSQTFDVLIFDPPHLPVHAASVHSSGIWRQQYGLTSGDNNGRDGDNINDLFRPFFHSAKMVVKPDGIILCKIIDMVHNHRYQWQHVALIQAAQSEGLTACDLLIKIDPCGGNLKSSKWKTVHHLRRNHCFWIVIRNGGCERRSVRV